MDLTNMSVNIDNRNETDDALKWFNSLNEHIKKQIVLTNYQMHMSIKDIQIIRSEDIINKKWSEEVSDLQDEITFLKNSNDSLKEVKFSDIDKLENLIQKLTESKDIIDILGHEVLKKIDDTILLKNGGIIFLNECHDNIIDIIKEPVSICENGITTIFEIKYIIYFDQNVYINLEFIHFSKNIIFLFCLRNHDLVQMVSRIGISLSNELKHTKDVQKMLYNISEILQKITNLNIIVAEMKNNIKSQKNILKKCEDEVLQLYTIICQQSRHQEEPRHQEEHRHQEHRHQEKPRHQEEHRHQEPRQFQLDSSETSSYISEEIHKVLDITDPKQKLCIDIAKEFIRNNTNFKACDITRALEKHNISEAASGTLINRTLKGIKNIKMLANISLRNEGQEKQEHPEKQEKQEKEKPEKIEKQEHLEKIEKQEKHPEQIEEKYKIYENRNKLINHSKHIVNNASEYIQVNNVHKINSVVASTRAKHTKPQEH